MSKSSLTLGSLFDGSGGFPLGGLKVGITPLWAAEVEPFPIRVTTKRLPQVEHLGNVCRLNGAKIPLVDIITFGSPCQSFSIAGKREGMEGKSGLFYEAVRIIREMLAATGGKYPKFAVMENVVGIFSSKTNGKSDFMEVINELVQTKSQAVSIPEPPNGVWSTSGEIVGDGFSLSWRTFDAQFWGVAQRRRRCYIVLDLAGERAGKILFDESRLRGNPPSCSLPWETVTEDTAAGSGGTVPVLNNQDGTLQIQGNGHQPVVFEPGATARLGKQGTVNMSGCLRADMGDNQFAVAIENHPADSRVPPVCESKAFGISSQTSNAMQSDNPYSGIYEADTARTLDTSGGRPDCNQGGVCVVSVKGSMIGRSDHNGPNGSGVNMDVSFTLDATDRHGVAYAMTTGSYTQICKETVPTLQARDYKDAPVVARPQYIVRRLTPTECALLQGFPSDWCAGLETPRPTKEDIAFWYKVWETHRRILGESSTPKSRKQIVEWLRDPYTDAAEYKMWGNGVALPCVVFVLGGIAAL